MQIITGAHVVQITGAFLQAKDLELNSFKDGEEKFIIVLT